MIVPGEGSQPALGMIVAFAPTRTGAILWPHARRIVEMALRSYGISLAEVYLTCAVKSVTLDGDGFPVAPTNEQVVDWLPILAREIAVTAPRAQLALGRQVARALTGLEGDIPYGSVIDNVYVVLEPTASVRPYVWAEMLSGWAEAVRG